MRRWWKAVAGLVLAALGYLRGFIDLVGEAQTVSDLPVLKWFVHPLFSLAAIGGACVFAAWVYYDLRLKRGQAGFVGTPGSKRRYRNQAIIGAALALTTLVVAPLLYGHYRRSGDKPTLAVQQQEIVSVAPEQKPESKISPSETGKDAANKSARESKAVATAPKPAKPIVPFISLSNSGSGISVQQVTTGPNSSIGPVTINSKPLPLVLLPLQVEAIAAQLQSFSGQTVQCRCCECFRGNG